MPTSAATRCNLCRGPMLTIRGGDAVACPHCDAPCHRGGNCADCTSVNRATPEHGE